MLTLEEKIGDLICKSGKTAKKISEETGIQQSTISDLRTGNRKTINSDTLISLCKYFNVSSDYLLGLVESDSIDEKIRNISYKIGLSTESILKLEQIKKDFPQEMKIIDKIISSFDFEDFIYSLYCYYKLKNGRKDFQQKSIDEIVDEDRERAMQYLSDSDDELTTVFVALKSNLNANDIAEFYLNRAEKEIEHIVKHLNEPMPNFEDIK